MADFSATGLSLLYLVTFERIICSLQCSSTRKADIRNPLRYLLMNAVASRSVSGSFQLPLTEASTLTRRLVLRALEAGECLSAFILSAASDVYDDHCRRYCQCTCQCANRCVITGLGRCSCLLSRLFAF